MKAQTSSLKNMALAAICLALALLLPTVAAGIPALGNAILPMHFPILICGFLCNWRYGAAVGFIAPLLRTLLFTMPPPIVAASMAVELAAYGLLTGLLYRKLPKKPVSIYISLLAAMVGGRILWALSKVALLGMGKVNFSLSIFLAEGFINAIPGIVAQIVIIPALIFALEKAGMSRE